jgi:regulator of sigma E protease
MITLSLVIFFFILFTLVIVHEAGHFIFAKLMKMRVDEFAFGFPPKLFSFTRGETKYSFNLIPLGGYVKIFGENTLEDDNLNLKQKEQNKKDKNRSFESKSASARIFVLLGGVIFNILATIIFFAISYMIGSQASIDTEQAKSISPDKRQVIVQSISPDSNLYKQGMRSGDSIVSVGADGFVLSQDGLYAESITELSKNNQNSIISINYITKETGKVSEVGAIPQAGIVEGKKVLGLALADIAYQKLNFTDAITRGASDTYKYIVLIFKELGKLIYGSIFGSDKIEDALAGPVGLAASTKDIASRDMAAILTFAGALSLSLAVFNILPIPALDGGRILFVLFEWPTKLIFKRKISKNIEQAFHALGFAFLIGLMVYITYFDILKLVN